MFRLRGLAVLGITLLITACATEIRVPKPVEPKVEGPTQGETPQIIPPPGPNIPVKSDRSALPKGAGAMLPSFDGQTFHVSLPKGSTRELSAKAVYDNVVRPVLRGVGFEEKQGRLRIPRNSGLLQSRAKLSSLAEVTCRELMYEGFTHRRAPGARVLCEAFIKGQGSPELDKRMLNGEGMTFAQYVADIQRGEIEYFFPQLHDNVLIEHTGIRAARWEGETITTVSGRVLNRYKISNKVVLSATQAASDVRYRLAEIKGICCPDMREPKGVVLILLPYGTADGLPGLKYAYRMRIDATWQQFARGPFLVWLDAETGKILELEPMVHADVTARGQTFHRAPDRLPATDLNNFRVNNSSGGQYILQLTDVFNRPDRLGDGNFDDGEASISDSASGSSATLANFNQATINDPSSESCSAGASTGFEQVSLFGKLSAYRQGAISAGLTTPFPTSVMSLTYENGFCNAFGSPTSISFGICTAYTDAACPDVANQQLNTIHDNTWVAHEFGHALTPRQYSDRPADWCVGPSLDGTPTAPCPLPTGRTTYHDFADSWSHHFENTNCWSGWHAKNEGGINNSLNCAANHSEGGWVPRLSEVTVPFNPADPRDHFPEHRALATGQYADMQIAGAALWSVRQGMRSKCLPSGTPQYFVRFVRALRNTGWFGAALNNNDRDVYRGLLDLEIKLADQWATSGSPGGPPGFAHNGAHSINKVTSGFARTGIFMVPPECIDGSAATTNATYCPSGETGADAIVDVDDNDPADDVTIDGVVHPERDFLRRAGPAPSFHVWTGPRYRFNGNNAEFPNPALCNAEYRVEVANDEAFSVNLTDSGWTAVNLNPANPNQCYALWTLPAPAWNTLDDGDRIYYRVSTRDAGGGNIRISTNPGNGLFATAPPPPYAVVNVLGQP